MSDLIINCVIKKHVSDKIDKHKSNILDDKTNHLKFGSQGLRSITDELGLIHLSFPENESPNFEGRVAFPVSYSTVSPKERLLLLFAENFRRQFSEKYQKRAPQVLAVKNECQVQVRNMIKIYFLLSLINKNQIFRNL